MFIHIHELMDFYFLVINLYMFINLLPHLCVPFQMHIPLIYLTNITHLINCLF